MLAGASLFFQNLHEPRLPDHELIHNELELGVLADSLGFDFVLGPEHHFSDYSIACENTQYFSWLAARTKQIKLFLGAVILPWHEPIRVAERVLMLDALSNGRVIFGMGRGLALREYQAFGIEMSESRERFDESASMVIEALESGFIEGNGPFYPQKKTELRPGPLKTFKDRTISVAMSPASGLAAAEKGLTIMCFVQNGVEPLRPIIDPYREAFMKRWGVEAPPPVLTDQCFCSEDREYAERMMREHYFRGYRSNYDHYRFQDDHFKKIKGYESYAGAAEEQSQVSIEELAETAMASQSYGTPSDIIENIIERRKVVGDFHALFTASHGGLPHDDVANSLKLIGEQVLPEIRPLGKSNLAADL